jgi:hypothetical protein
VSILRVLKGDMMIFLEVLLQGGNLLHLNSLF